MGLDFDVDGWDADTPHWSYSGFNHFRTRLAAFLGLNWEALCAGKAEWPVKDALQPLLYHSDCDGEMSPDECAMVGPRLKEVLAAMPDEAVYAGIDYDKQEGAKLVACMEACAALKKPLVFC